MLELSTLLALLHFLLPIHRIYRQWRHRLPTRQNLLILKYIKSVTFQEYERVTLKIRTNR